ncbi:MAG: metal-dependent hydrolase [Gammaproteobacteria bacterium]|nr:metal-dependent hydrolase [Gammaproteobacteria bacterium]
MDSVTQLLLGAAVGEATAGRHIGRRAALWGAVCGTLPDLDVFIPLGDAVLDFTYHRSASHSLLVLAMVTPLIVWLMTKIHPNTSGHHRRLIIMIYLVFATHVLLDSFTVYGTQIFWPLYTTPMTWSTIFIIDPLYTIPLLFGVLAVLFNSRNKAFGYLANIIGLVISSAYLLWTLGVKLHVDDTAQSALQNQRVSASKVLTTPTPFNSQLWRVLAVDDEYYYEGYYSILDNDKEIRFVQYPRSRHLVEFLSNSWAVRRLQWFTKDFYAAGMHQNDIVLTDLRMGLEPDYVFSFKVGEMHNPHPKPVTPERVETVRNLQRLNWVWARIWDEQAQPTL